MIRTVVTCFAVTLYASTALAQSTAFNPNSLLELRRIYGTARPPSAEVLQTRRVEDLRRLDDGLRSEAAQISAVTALMTVTDMATPSTIDSTGLLTLLDKPSTSPVYLLLWHQIALDLTAIDFAPVALTPVNSTDPNIKRTQEQPGPPRTARALAIIHLAMFEAANHFDPRYATVVDKSDPGDTAGASANAAIVEAAFVTMSKLYPGLVGTDTTICSDKTPQLSLAHYHRCSIEALAKGTGDVAKGQAIGASIGKAVYDSRIDDHANEDEPTFDRNPVPLTVNVPQTDARVWRPDPVSNIMLQLGGKWGDVTPFAAGVKTLATPHSPYALATDPAMLDHLPSYELVRQLGAENRLAANAIPNNHDGLYVAQYWAYDGTASVCAPARLYNQLALAALADIEANASHATANKLDPANTADVARYFALVNLAMNDAAITAWAEKYKYQFARPVTYIRKVEADKLNTSPREEGGTDPRNQPVWLPIGAQTTNAERPFNVTPPFPSYPSGHAVFGGAVAGVMRQFIKNDAAFLFRSDEFNGHNRDAFNYVRCDPATDTVTPNTFCEKRTLTIDCSERENADSRVLMGVHWLFDADDGVVLGNKVAREVFPLLKRLDTAETAIRYSVDPATATRKSLQCPDVRYSPSWKKADALTAELVAP